MAGHRQVDRVSVLDRYRVVELGVWMIATRHLIGAGPEVGRHPAAVATGHQTAFRMKPHL